MRQENFFIILTFSLRRNYGEWSKRIYYIDRTREYNRRWYCISIEWKWFIDIRWTCFWNNQTFVYDWLDFRKIQFYFTGDFMAVLRKFSHVLLPRQSSSLLQQWDLWGPLILITTLAILLQSRATHESNGVQFAEVFSLMFIGAIVVTVS